ncbi:LptF/LptG family permease [Phreatobacter sp.]|uniref:LptF/LptG family permease n=1 Tax=Phreatobacter sp. TaxID=1966341 RepID=UPI0025D1E282|nr:LptF/LptG family permease [Phreatobacter sp.]
MTALQTPVPADAKGRHFGLVAFGTYTRTLTLAHASHIGTVVAALLIVALTLDLAARANQVVAQASGGVPGLILHMGWYLLLRICDLIGNLLPLACFMGLFWSEITLTQSRERIVIWNGGRSPLQSLMPIAVLGVLLGALQVTALAVLRPTAVGIQIETQLGGHGEWFDRQLKPEERRWIVLPNHMVQARIDYRNRTLVDVQLFELSEAGRLAGRMAAASAVPADVPGIWIFRNGSRWTAPAEGAPSPAQGTGTARRFAEERIALPLEPLWLANLGIDARYLPQPTLSQLASIKGLNEPSYQAWWHVRIAQAVLPLGMMLMASALAMTLLAQRTLFRPMILIGLAGYFLYVTNNIVVWLGEYGQLPPLLAAWLMPLAMIVTALGLMMRMERAGRD